MNIKHSEEVLAEDPRTIKLTDLVGQLLKIRREFGLNPTTLRVNPSDEFLIKFNVVQGLRVVHDYNVPLGNIVLL